MLLTNSVLKKLIKKILKKFKKIKKKNVIETVTLTENFCWGKFSLCFRFLTYLSLFTFFFYFALRYFVI